MKFTNIFFVGVIATALFSLIGCGGNGVATPPPALDSSVFADWSKLKVGEVVEARNALTGNTNAVRRFKVVGFQKESGATIAAISAMEGTIGGPGDSGTPLYNKAGEIVGAIYAGYEKSALYMKSAADVLGSAANYLALGGTRSAISTPEVMKGMLITSTALPSGVRDFLANSSRSKDRFAGSIFDGPQLSQPIMARSATVRDMSAPGVDMSSWNQGARYSAIVGMMEDGSSIALGATVFAKDPTTGLLTATGHALGVGMNMPNMPLSRGVVDFQLSEGAIVCHPDTNNGLKSLAFDSANGSVIKDVMPDMVKFHVHGTKAGVTLPMQMGWTSTELYGDYFGSSFVVYQALSLMNHNTPFEKVTGSFKITATNKDGSTDLYEGTVDNDGLVGAIMQTLPLNMDVYAKMRDVKIEFTIN